MFQSISLCCGVLRNVSCVECFLAFLVLLSVCGVEECCCRSECCGVFSNISYCFVVFLCVP